MQIAELTNLVADVQAMVGEKLGVDSATPGKALSVVNGRISRELSNRLRATFRRSCDVVHPYRVGGNLLVLGIGASGR